MVSNTFPPPPQRAEDGSPKAVVFPEEDRTPKALVFPEDKKMADLVDATFPKPPSLFPDEQKPAVPEIKPLVFNDPVIARNQQAASDYIKEQEAKEKIRKLDFGNVPPAHTPSPAPRPNPVYVPPKVQSVFDDHSQDKVVLAAVEYVNKNHASMGYTNERIERQIRQLCPLKLDILIAWGQAAVEANATLSSNVAKCIKEYTELNANELTEAALEAAKYDPSQDGLLHKMFQAKPKPILFYKPRLIVLQSQLVAILPKMQKWLDEATELQQLLTLNLASLAGVCEASGASQDNTLEQTAQNRRTLLAQAANQAQLVGLQLKQTQQLISDQLARCTQMLNVTIPAFEMANASK